MCSRCRTTGENDSPKTPDKNRASAWYYVLIRDVKSDFTSPAVTRKVSLGDIRLLDYLAGTKPLLWMAA